jgi:hypothetical protein
MCVWGPTLEISEGFHGPMEILHSSEEKWTGPNGYFMDIVFQGTILVAKWIVRVYVVQCKAPWKYHTCK